MKHTLLCIDGMEESGQPLPSFTQSKLVRYGTVRTAPGGVTPDSLPCILRLLGASEAEIPTGRAALEALAMGLTVENEDAFLRCTLCALDSRGALAPPPKAAAGLIVQMCAELALPAGWTLHPMSGYRAILCVRGGAKDLPELYTMPPHQQFGAFAEGCLPRGGALGKALAGMAKESAQIAQAGGKENCILMPWGQSAPCAMTEFAARTGVAAAMICHAEIVRGIALALGMDCPHIQRATADIDTNLFIKYSAARALGDAYPLVIVHVNGCDEAAHRRDLAQKNAFLQRIRQELFEPLHAGLAKGERMLLCSDHRTSSATGAHELGAIHFWLYEGEGTQAAVQDAFEDAGAPLRLLLAKGDEK